MSVADAVTVVGDALLDRDVVGHAERLAPDAPVPVLEDPVARARPGGAALAAALLAADGLDVTLVTALGADAAGEQVRRLLEGARVRVVNLPGSTATGEKVRIRADGQWVARIDYGGRGGPGARWTTDAEQALTAASTVLVSDYGRGLTGSADVRAALAGCCGRVPVVWDPHPRGGQPVEGISLATPNVRETGVLAGAPPADDLGALTTQAGRLRERWRAHGVVVTRGARGALLVAGDGTPLAVPAAPVPVGDVCGAGDRFATALTRLLAAGRLPSEAVGEAVAAATTFVAQGGAGAWAATPSAPSDPKPEEAPVATDLDATLRMIGRVRDAGGTIVATGGCFDLLHAGHVQVLRAARALGDCLVVCLNSDDSVSRLKGPSRPLVGQHDRATVLAGLEGVDGVVVFEEDTPEAVLARLRPHVWAKGADYAVADLPEARLMATWGGQAVVLPFLPGRSTTQLLNQAALQAVAPTTSTERTW